MNLQPSELLKNSKTENVKSIDAKGLWVLYYRSIAGKQNAIVCSSLYCYSIDEIIVISGTEFSSWILYEKLL